MNRIHGSIITTVVVFTNYSNITIIIHELNSTSSNYTYQVHCWYLHNHNITVAVAVSVAVTVTVIIFIKPVNKLLSQEQLILSTNFLLLNLVYTTVCYEIFVRFSSLHIKSIHMNADFIMTIMHAESIVFSTHHDEKHTPANNFKKLVVAC